jgi:hypothetical protein
VSGVQGNKHATEKRLGKRNGADFWITPVWAVDALLDREQFVGRVWDPCCGEGVMGRCLEVRGYEVANTDLVARGARGTHGGIDFLMEPAMWRGTKSIICNAPFNLGTKFLQHALALKPEVLAMFCRLAFLEGDKRQAIFAETPPCRVWVFSRRVTLRQGDIPAEVVIDRGASAYAWFVWRRLSPSGTQIGWIA